MKGKALRYVVLRHVGHDRPHFDLMLERDGGSLRTFRVEKWPVTGRQELTPLADHRRVYLGYEGPVSGGRGSVRRVEAGVYFEARGVLTLGGARFVISNGAGGVTWIEPASE